MAYDEDLADRIRMATQDRDDLSERKMFGGLAFLVSGHMAVAASGQGGLMVRIHPEESETLVSEPGVDRFEMHGRAMDGWLHVAPDVLGSESQLDRWVALGVEFASTLPPK